jgi:hypothetical protein
LLRGNKLANKIRVMSRYGMAAVGAKRTSVRSFKILTTEELLAQLSA